MNRPESPIGPEPSDFMNLREARIGELGRVLLEAGRPRAWSGGAWFERLTESMLRDEGLRIQVLRFVDVLPTLSDDHHLLRHLQEYFGGGASGLPPLLGWGLSKAHYSPALTARVIRKALLLVAERFIGGKESGEALNTIISLRRQNLGFSLDLLGEAVVSETEACRYQAAYLKLIEDLGPVLLREPAIPLLDRVDGRAGPGLYLSLKLTSLYSRVSPVNFQGSVDAICARLRPILHAARAHRAFVCIDMEQYDYKAIVLEIFKKLLMEDEFRDWSDVGIAIQAYLRETREDLVDLVRWAEIRGTPVTIRLVRGAYWDYETVIARQRGWKIPVWTEKSATDWCYEQCLEFLLGHHPIVRTAAATHNVRSIGFAMAFAEERRLRPDQIEFQMLYGMAPGLQQAVAAQGYCVRVYVPYGEPVPGMAYLVRRLLENSSGQSLLIPDRVNVLNPPQAPEPSVAPEPGPNSGPESEPTGEAAERLLQSRFVNEPLHRFTDRRDHQSMHAAIDAMRRGLGEYYPLRINGERIETEGFIESVNPANPAEVIGRVAVADTRHAERAIAGAREAFPNWSALPGRERARILIRAAALLRERRDRFAALEILEAGKTWLEADANVTEAIDFLEFYAREAVRLDAPEVVEVPGEYNLHGYTPLGVGVIIPPWNFPLAILTGMLSGAIVTGNTVILKPSSQTPVIAAHFVDLFREAGLPDGVVQYLPGPGSTLGQTLVEHPDIHFVAFTGSEAVGTSLIETAGRRRPGQKHIKRVIAEMGGKNAIIVDRDAELDETVNGIIRSAFGYQGQKCSACSRLIVVGKQYRILLTRLVEASLSLAIGNPEDPAINFGPVIERAAMQRIQAAIREGRTAARVEVAVDVPENLHGFFVGPTIVSDVPRDSFLFREEIFGPVLSVLPADDLDQALELANDCAYALTGGLYSRSPSTIERVKRDFQVGNLYINRAITGALVSRQPFGGFKMSGIGSKAGGRSYLTQFLNQRAVTENTLRRGFAPSVDLTGRATGSGGQAATL